MKIVSGLAFPDADRFMADALVHDPASDKFLYQQSHLTAAMRYVTNRDCAIDGGAHVGTWSLVMSGTFRRVIAVEPSPDTFECLDRNLREAGCQNVECHQVALGASAGSVSMTLDPEQAQRANTGARFVQPGGTIPVVTIDSLHVPSLGFLKLDIEGSEFAALQGAKETLLRCKPIVLFENKRLWTRHYGVPKDAVSRYLSGLGYRHLERVSMDEIWGAA